jgi:4-diphosphocytidyl-2-C-methyl-D-erythritol kinase
MTTAKASSAMPAQPRLLRAEDGGLRAWAPAKINLNLLVGPRRDDGYHGLDSLVAKVTLYDRIDLRPRGDGRIRFSCAGADCGPDEKNLALKAARALAAAVPASGRGVDIELHKRIPPGKGLGGGSSDAAAVLAALHELWGAPLNAGELQKLAMTLGSDVPLFLGPPASRMTGRGEVLAPIDVHPFAAVLILPACECSTAAVYRAFDDMGKTRARETRDRPHFRPPKVGSVPSFPGEQIDLAVLSRPPSTWRGLLRNDLSAGALQVSPQLAVLWDGLRAAIAPPVCLSGSGSGLFVLCDDEAEALALVPAIRRACPGAPGQAESEAGAGAGFECVVVRNNPW